MFDHDFVEWGNLVPLYVHGDGGRTYRRDELMVVQFQGAMGFGSRKSHPTRKLKAGVNLQHHSFITRFLIGVMPKASYKDAPETFEAFLEKAMEDFASLYFQGLQISGRVLRFLVLGLKGDLPFLAKAGNMTRTFLHIRKRPQGPNSKPLTGCCWLCGAGTDSVPFEDFGASPLWMSTSGVNNINPWDRLPCFFNHVPHVPNDKGQFFKLDLLHIYHLGIGRDFCGSSLAVSLGLYGLSIPDSLGLMNADLRSFLKSSRKQVHFRTLTRDLLGYVSEAVYPTGHWSKAMDTPVLMHFLAWLLTSKFPEELRASKELRIIASACQAMSQFMHILLAGGLWLSQDEASSAAESGLYFLAAYGKLASLYFEQRACRYNLTPKLHCFHHVCMNLKVQSSKARFCLNPIGECTFQDEDFVGRVSRLSRRVSPRMQCQRTIERYLTATRHELRMA